MCIIIVDVHQFIVQCLISLDPCTNVPIKRREGRVKQICLLQGYITYSGMEVTLDCKLHWYPKFYSSVAYSLAQKLYYFYWILIGGFIKLSIQSFLPLILIFRRGNFVYHHWRCTSIYRPLSLGSCKGCRKYVDVMTGEKLSLIWLAYMKLVYWLVRKGFRRGGIVF